MFKITGIVTYVSPVETFGAGKESKRIIVETQDKYPNHFPISFYGAKMDAIKSVKQGDLVEVETFPGGRLKKGDNTTAFTFLNGFNCLIVPMERTSSESGPSTHSNTKSTPSQEKLQNFTYDDGIPF